MKRLGQVLLMVALAAAFFAAVLLSVRSAELVGL